MFARAQRNPRLATWGRSFHPDYDREGVQEYWIVDPDARSMTVLRRPRAGAGLTDVATTTAEAGAVLESPLFPGLRIPLRDVFRLE